MAAWILPLLVTPIEEVVLVENPSNDEEATLDAHVIVEDPHLCHHY